MTLRQKILLGIIGLLASWLFTWPLGLLLIWFFSEVNGDIPTKPEPE